MITGSKAVYLEPPMTFYSPLQTSGDLPLSSSLSLILDRCLSLPAAQAIHAHLLKLDLHRHTFLGNRLLHLYSRLGAVAVVLRAFDDIPTKNTFTWNILLASFSIAGRTTEARQVFDKMPQRDIVSWNSLISVYVSNGFVESAKKTLCEMRELGIRSNGYTLSISASYVYSPLQAKQLHGSAVRGGFHSSNTVVGNSLVDMYGKIGLVGYAFAVFRSLENPDNISWNSIISAFGKSGSANLAFGCFRSMKNSGFFPDEFTISIMISICSENEELAKGEQLQACCFKIGALSNSIVSSAVIHMYSHCGRLGDSLRFFAESEKWDSAIVDSLASAYARSGLVHEALKLFAMALRENIRPTEFTFGTILSSNSCFGMLDQGTQIHCWIHKLGMEADSIVSSSLLDMYMKLGSVESATKIFSSIPFKDLISWNAMIMGLAQNGQAEEGLVKFEEVLANGIRPDRITLLGVLSACSLGGLLREGKQIFSSMEKEHGMKPDLEHYYAMVEMMGRAGKLEEAMELIETMDLKPDVFIWDLLLEVCMTHGSLSYAEDVAQKMMEMEPRSYPFYSVMEKMYGARGKWESMAKVRKMMQERRVRRKSECCWIGIKNEIFSFSADEVLHHGGEITFSVLKLLVWEIVEKGYVQGEKKGVEIR
ncbi:Pentatricopeptide repeat-containing protein [Apostasia shenzhenica]|uniref:Pentatricopeptide repeat-containing protein n=1 Tax=Apostasia shenzhenica TaxID=1088818 RepID=A0A2I0AQA4_9ASPA|nr:Pentatricopeptide repeat-containing protein [Apostasia shenzhenica]